MYIVIPSVFASQAREACTAYHSCVEQANERHAALLRTKREVVQQTRELLLNCDHTVKTVTVRYFQMQQQVAAEVPLQV